MILDEIGRGTSTFDGLSIAWAVAEYLHETPGLSPRTLFATHYHELADLARTHARVGNAHFDVREWGEDVIFLRRLLPGRANRSYGIQVARLAGLPAAVIERAREILRNLEGGELDEQGRPRLAGAASVRLASSRSSLRARRAIRASWRRWRPCARSTRSGPRRSTRWRCSRACTRCSRRSRHDAARPLALLCALALFGLLGVDRPSGLGDVVEIRHWSYPDYTRVVVELTQPVRTVVRELPADQGSGRPARLYLDLAGVWVGRRFADGLPVGDGLLQGVRLGQNTTTSARLVLDLERYDRHRLIELSHPDRRGDRRLWAPAHGERRRGRPASRTRSAACRSTCARCRRS